MGKSPDIIVIGGGVVGLTIARALARDGMSVTLLERNVCGREASWAGAGIISPCDPHREDPLVHFRERSLSLYGDYCRALYEETGIDPEYEVCGELEVLFDDHALSVARSTVRGTEGRTMPDGGPLYTLHSPDAARRVEPALSPEIAGALECHQTAQVRNPRLLRALYASCVKAGVDIRERTGVDDLVNEGDRVTGVRTEGETVSGGVVVLCAGAWSSRIGSRLSSVMPVHPVRGQMILMKLDERPFTQVRSRGKTYLAPRRDGHVLLGSTEEPEAGFDTRNTPEGIARLTQMALRLAPSLRDAPITATWAGLRPGTPDDKPYLGCVPGFEGLFAATGHYRTGLTNAPATAEFVAAALQGRSFDIDLSCCRPGRA